jgi:hypothetical protein
MPRSLTLRKRQTPRPKLKAAPKGASPVKRRAGSKRPALAKLALASKKPASKRGLFAKRIKLSPRISPRYSLNKKGKSPPARAPAKRGRRKEKVPKWQQFIKTKVAIILMIGITGVLVCFSTTQALAVNVTVHGANYEGPVPTSIPEILSPLDGAVLTSLPVPVTGTCEAGPGYFIKLFRNGVFAGSGICQNNATFSIDVQLFPGNNTLIAHSANGANIEGPESSSITVTYYPPAPAAITTPQTKAPGNAFYVSPEYFLLASNTGEEVSESFKFLGGTKPYRMTIIWGDGYSDTKENINADTVAFKHVYKSRANIREDFTINVKANDAGNQFATMQLFAVMNDPAIGAQIINKPVEPAGVYRNIILRNLRYAWPAYIVLLLMGLCFYIGERRGESIVLSMYRESRRRKVKRQKVMRNRLPA